MGILQLVTFKEIPVKYILSWLLEEKKLDNTSEHERPSYFFSATVGYQQFKTTYFATCNMYMLKHRYE